MANGDAGRYECFATNDNGTAVDKPVVLLEAWIHHFANAEPKIYQVELGDSFQMHCNPPNSSPKAKVFWILMGNQQGAFNPLSGMHLSQDDAGSLFFHYVNLSDAKNDTSYTCVAENEALRDYKFGNKFKLIVNENKRRTLAEARNIVPEMMYTGQSANIALLGSTHRIHCFYSGFPVPKPIWYFKDKTITDKNTEYKFDNYGRTLVFSVTQEKEGSYSCEIPDISKVYFTVRVEGAPFWTIAPPQNRNVTEGDTIEFNCSADGVPTPAVTFYKNGIPLPLHSNRHSIFSNLLSIHNASRGSNGTGDNAVYQCEAANTYGKIWSNFYLNFHTFAPEIVDWEDEVDAPESAPVELSCKFFAIPPANVIWNSTLLPRVNHSIRHDNHTGIVKLVIHSMTSDAFGEYQCTGWNRYGNSTAKMTLVRKGELSFSTRVFRVTWWIWLLLVLVVLVLLLVCCHILKSCRHRGDTYPVSQQERHRGRRPLIGKPVPILPPFPSNFNQMGSESPSLPSSAATGVDSKSNSSGVFSQTGHRQEQPQAHGYYNENGVYVDSNEIFDINSANLDSFLADFLLDRLLHRCGLHDVSTLDHATPTLQHTIRWM
ncbi:hypothetical protein WR25_24375 [Diploscapter pachys]|uniref:Ig-like domain-containing protein n=1 Tax=Diploscapter pachys TaxID=2018661 RepID=A0A2A2LS14_9BILA|nr:hypothetical protein WR25_24375 [Diploscapter pachys]